MLDEAIRALGGADAAIILAAEPKACEQEFASRRRNGRLVFVGLPRDDCIRLPIFETVLNGISVTGSIVGTRVDLAETFQLHADGRTRVVQESRKLEDVNGCFHEVLSGAVDARLVFDMHQPSGSREGLWTLQPPRRTRHCQTAAKRNGVVVYTQIIVPFDGGEFSAGAIDVGRRLAGLMNAPMRIIAFASNKSRADALTSAVQSELEALTDIQVAWSVRITGNTVDALAAEWSKYPGALVCMRSVGRSRTAPVLGSFAEGVLYNMYGPVLLVGPHANTDEFRPEGAMVVCSDGSDTAEKILPIAAQWAITLPLEPWIVNVSDSAGQWIDTELRARDIPTDITHAWHVAHELEKQIGRAVQHEALHGAHPARAIAAFADEQKATLIAMSTHGATGIRRVALGSVTMAVVHCAPCPVLVYRPPHVPKY